MELKERQAETAKMLKLSKAEKNAKQKQRYDTVLLYLEGYTPKEYECQRKSEPGADEILSQKR